MKISPRTVLKIARLYGLADDTTPLKALRHLTVTTTPSYVSASFTLATQQYQLLYGSMSDELSLDQLWPDQPANATLLPNPHDPQSIETPFQGKQVVMRRIVPTRQRLDIFLSRQFDRSISRSLWQTYIKTGCVTVNGRVVTRPSAEVDLTDTITVNFPEKPDETYTIPMIYQDDDILVVNKPSGLLTHAKGGHTNEQTLAESMRHKTTFASDSNRPGIVHRLDRETSGVMVLARTAAAAAELQRQFANRTVRKTYVAIVDGVPHPPAAYIDIPIARSLTQPQLFRADANGKSAQTAYQVIATNGALSLVKLHPKTGRTHQLRVHLAQLGTPIVGDRFYNHKKGQGGRLMLHAWQLTLQLPSGEAQTFRAPLPPEFLAQFPTIREKELCE